MPRGFEDWLSRCIWTSQPHATWQLPVSICPKETAAIAHSLKDGTCLRLYNLKILQLLVFFLDTWIHRMQQISQCQGQHWHASHTPSLFWDFDGTASRKALLLCKHGEGESRKSMKKEGVLEGMLRNVANHYVHLSTSYCQMQSSCPISGCEKRLFSWGMEHTEFGRTYDIYDRTRPHPKKIQKVAKCREYEGILQTCF